jgi:glucose-1-phosphate adenylyltransferase
VLSPRVIIGKGAVVRDSIIMHNCNIGEDSVIDLAILDEGVKVGAACHIGYGSDYYSIRRRPKVSTYGLTLIGKNRKIPDGVTIGRDVIV